MAGWIPLDKDLADDPRVLRLADYLIEHRRAEAHLTEPQVALLRQGASNEVLGGLYRLWRYADTHVRTGNTLSVRYSTLADVTRLPLHVIQKLPTEWLIANGNDTVTLPDYTEKNATFDKDIRKRKTRLRVRRWRERQRRSGNALVKRESNTEQRYGNALTKTETETNRVSGSVSDPSTLSAGAPRRGASAKGAAAPAPRHPPEVAWQPPAKGSTWTSWSAPPEPRKGSFDDEFKKRFGTTPTEASKMRAEAEAKEKPNRPPPKAPDEEIPR